MLQWYGNVPAFENVKLPCPPDGIVATENAPVFEITLCVVLSLFIHTTFEPTGTVNGLTPNASAVLVEAPDVIATFTLLPPGDGDGDGAVGDGESEPLPPPHMLNESRLTTQMTRRHPIMMITPRWRWRTNYENSARKRKSAATPREGTTACFGGKSTCFRRDATIAVSQTVPAFRRS